MNNRFSKIYSLILVALALILFDKAYPQGNNTLSNDSSFNRLSPQKLILIKENCLCDIAGYRLRIKYNTNSIQGLSDCDYSFEPVFSASDSLKIQILEQLLQLVKDTSVCCKKMKAYSLGLSKKPYSESYTLQIDALYIFNFIAFGVYTKHYSACPVLFDTLSRREINFDQEKMKEVYEIYNTWFTENKKGGFKNYVFPLINTRYQWFGGNQKAIRISRLPNSPTQATLGVPVSYQRQHN